MNEPVAAAGAVAEPKPVPAESHEVLEVAFKARRREYFANPKEILLRTGDWIIVQAERGEDLGKVHHTHEWIKREHLGGSLRPVLRLARPEDLERMEQNRVKEAKAVQTCKERIAHREIEMKLVDAEYQYDGNRVTFFFTAEKRVDFRDLVKDLASIFRTRIELRQIGVRDESGRIGGVGTCGRELCCATWLRDFEPITLKMAKDQGLSPSPSKISGACGRLKCCLRYELDFYKEAAREFPKIGSRMEWDGVDYEVGRVDIFHRTLTLHDEAGKENIVTLDDVPTGTKIVGPSRDRRKGCDKNGCGSRGAKPGDGGGHDDHGPGHTHGPERAAGAADRGASASSGPAPSTERREPRREMRRPERPPGAPAPRRELPRRDSPQSAAPSSQPAMPPRPEERQPRTDAPNTDAPPQGLPPIERRELRPGGAGGNRDRRRRRGGRGRGSGGQGGGQAGGGPSGSGPSGGSNNPGPGSA